MLQKLAKKVLTSWYFQSLIPFKKLTQRQIYPKIEQGNTFNEWNLNPGANLENSVVHRFTNVYGM